MDNPKIEYQRIDPPPSLALDTIEVFWLDYGPCRGMVTVTCYGASWTAYFGGMGEQSIREFFASVDVDYMVGKMHAPTLKEGKGRDAYLTRIVQAVQMELRKT